jgi:hypothetical protein
MRWIATEVAFAALIGVCLPIVGREELICGFPWYK